MTLIQQPETKFTTNPMEGLLRCQHFNAAWLTTLTTWSTRVRPPFSGGPVSEGQALADLQESVIQAIVQVVSSISVLVHTVSGHQFRIDGTPNYQGTGQLHDLGMAAWERAKAASFAVGLIRTLDAADSCFSFGPHFSGGDQAQRRETFFSSTTQYARMEAYAGVIYQLGQTLLQTEPGEWVKKDKVPSRQEIDSFHELSKPAAFSVLEGVLNNSMRIFTGIGHLLNPNSPPREVDADQMLKEVSLDLGFVDKALRTAEALFDAIPSFAEALHSIGEEELAKRLQEIGEIG